MPGSVVPTNGRVYKTLIRLFKLKKTHPNHINLGLPIVSFQLIILKNPQKDHQQVPMPKPDPTPSPTPRPVRPPPNPQPPPG